MKMRSLKSAKPVQDEMVKPTSIVDKPEYPWGTSINLEHDSIEQLGIDKLPAFGEKLQMTAIVKVTNVGSNESETGKRKHMTLQITDMAIEPEKNEEDVAKTLYK